MPLLFVVSIVVNIGMWLERYVIVVMSLHRDFVPAAWGMYHGTFWDYATYYGTIGLFFTLMFLFIRFLPVISIAEMRELVLETQERAERERAARARRADARRGGARAMSTHDAPRMTKSEARLYGLLAEFTVARGAARGGAEGLRARATGGWTPTRRSRSRGWPRRSASTRNRMPADRPDRRPARRRRRLRHDVVLGGDQLPDQRRRQAAA